MKYQTDSILGFSSKEKARVSTILLRRVASWAVSGAFVVGFALLFASTGLAQTKTCFISGVWTGSYAGTTVNKDGKTVLVSGDFAATIFQSGTATSSVFYVAGYSVGVPGSNINNKVSFGPVSVSNTVDTAGGAFGSHCVGVSGTFLVNRKRPISGGFSMQRQTLMPPRLHLKQTGVTLGVRG